MDRGGKGSKAWWKCGSLEENVREKKKKYTGKNDPKVCNAYGWSMDEVWETCGTILALGLILP